MSGSICEVCSKTFSKKYNLTKHIKTIHNTCTNKFICQDCNKTFNVKYSLVRHINTVHNRPGKSKIIVWQCSMCGFRAQKQSLTDHYSQVHNFDMSLSNFEFKSLRDFEFWKDAMQKETSSKFIKVRIKSYGDKVRYYYRCYRDGLYKPSGKNIRKLKQSGSNKINGYCPARIDVKLDNGTGMVFVKYLKSHVGHSLEIEKLVPGKTKKGLGNDEIILKDLTNCSSPSSPQDLDLLKTSLLEKAKDIIDSIKSFEDYKIVEKILLPLPNTLASLKRQQLPQNIVHSISDFQ